MAFLPEGFARGSFQPFVDVNEFVREMLDGRIGVKWVVSGSIQWTKEPTISLALAARLMNTPVCSCTVCSTP